MAFGIVVALLCLSGCTSKVIEKEAMGDNKPFISNLVFEYAFNFNKGEILEFTKIQMDFEDPDGENFFIVKISSDQIDAMKFTLYNNTASNAGTLEVEDGAIYPTIDGNYIESAILITVLIQIIDNFDNESNILTYSFYSGNKRNPIPLSIDN